MFFVRFVVIYSVLIRHKGTKAPSLESFLIWFYIFVFLCVLRVFVANDSVFLPQRHQDTKFRKLLSISLYIFAFLCVLRAFVAGHSVLLQLGCKMVSYKGSGSFLSRNGWISVR